jgi:hypothetical protein
MSRLELKLLLTFLLNCATLLVHHEVEMKVLTSLIKVFCK